MDRTMIVVTNGNVPSQRNTLGFANGLLNKTQVKVNVSILVSLYLFALRKRMVAKPQSYNTDMNRNKV